MSRICWFFSAQIVHSNWLYKCAYEKIGINILLLIIIPPFFVHFLIRIFLNDEMNDIFSLSYIKSSNVFRYELFLIHSFMRWQKF